MHSSVWRVAGLLLAVTLPALAQDPLEAKIEGVNWPVYQDATVKTMQDYLRVETRPSTAPSPSW